MKGQGTRHSARFRPRARTQGGGHGGEAFVRPHAAEMLAGARRGEVPVRMALRDTGDNIGTIGGPD